MKKTISIILAVLMLACCMPFSVFAFSNTVVFSTSDSFTDSHQLDSNVEYVIKNGVTMTVPSGFTLYIPQNAQITVEKGATLNVVGEIRISDFGALYSSGIIINGDHVKKDNGAENAAAMVQLRFPDLNSADVQLKDKIEVSFSYEGAEEQNVPDYGCDYFVPMNTEIHINAHIIEPDAIHDKYDDSKLNVKLNGTTQLPYVTGANLGTGYFKYQTITGGDISYAKWTTANNSDFLTTKRIILPSGEGYEVKSRFPVTKTEDGAIVVKYGDPFSFYVDVDEAYDMSKYEVYIHDGYGWMLITAPNNVAAKADDYGYYNIPAVEGDITITVTGVMKNSTISLIGNILETFRNIFKMLQEFFENFQSLFGNNG